jgi:NAD(P)-dependent dehydrogenase (short-subunit alcohol dehydrogenase family)
MSGGVTVDLGGRVALVTGASSGIGAQFARSLAMSGAAVVLAARRVERLKALADDIERAGGKALSVAMDVADEDSTQAAFDAAETAFGGVDTVVANAGVSYGGSAMGLKMEDFDATLSINLRGVFLTAREGARRMVAQFPPEQERGRVVLIASITAHRAWTAMAAYSATKAAVVQLGRTMAREWAGKGVNVNVLCPGYIRTEMTDELWTVDRGRDLLNSFPRRRLLDLDSLDPLLLYFCSDASRQLTGSVISVDDGQSLG